MKREHLHVYIEMTLSEKDNPCIHLKSAWVAKSGNRKRITWQSHNARK